MNIFAIYECPVKCGIYATDAHVVKMPLECGQMLANCFSQEMLERDDCPRTKKGTVRKYSHYNHPCSLWVRESRSNMRWMIQWARSLDKERMIRYNKENPHFTMEFIKWTEDNIEDSLVPEGDLTTFAQAMDEEFKNNDPILAYRDFYKYEKALTHTWKRNKPEWI